MDQKELEMILMSMDKNKNMPWFMKSKMFSYAVSEVEINSKAPRPLIFMSAISSLSMAAQSVIDVQVPTGQLLPVSLMTLVVGDSGERKSGVLKYFLAPIREVQNERKAIFDERNSLYKIEKELWSSRRKALFKEGAKAESECERLEVLQALHAFDRSKPVPPVNYKLIYEDSTSQALFNGLAGNYPYAGLISSEGKEILNGRAFNDLPKQNSIWSGDPVAVDRVTAESYVVEGARLVVSIMVQGDIFQKYLERRGSEARASGLWARFLVAYPESTRGTRFEYAVGKNWECMSKFGARLKDIINEGFDIYDSGGTRKILSFTQQAKKTWVALFNEVEREMLDRGDYARAPDHASKIMDNVSRVAALLSYFESGDVEISEDYFQDAIELCFWCSRQFMNMFVSKSQIEKDADILLLWLENCFSDGVTKVAKSDIQRLGPNSVRRNDRLSMALEFLVENSKIEIWKELGVRYVGPKRRVSYRRRRDDSVQ